MRGIVFLETLRRGWRETLYWGLGLGVLAFFQVIVVPDADALRQMAELLESMPEGFVAAFGGIDAEFNASPEGYLALNFFSIILLMMAIYPVLAGISVSAGDEDRGILDMVMAQPLPRWRLILEKFAAYTVMMVGITAIMFAWLWAGIAITPSMTVSMSRVFQTTANILPGLWIVLAFTAMAGALMRRKNMAIALAAVFVVGGYFIDAIGRAASTSVINDLRVISYYRYYDATEVIRNGIVWNNVAILTLFSLIFIAAAVTFFNRRDIAV